MIIGSVVSEELRWRDFGTDGRTDRRTEGHMDGRTDCTPRPALATQLSWVSLPRDALCQGWLKLAQGLWRRWFIMSSMCFGYYIISLWKRVGSFICMNLNHMLCAEIGPVVLEKKIFRFRQCFFHYFVIISPWKRAGPYFWTTLNPLYPRMLCAKFGWNWPSGSGEKDENVKS